MLLVCISAVYAYGQCSYNINALGSNDLVNWDGHHISNVTITGDGISQINNTNSNTRYTDYTAQSVNVTAGSTYNFSIINDKGGNQWGDVKVRIWIDYNNDGNYTQVFDSGAYVENYGDLTHTISGSFDVDPTAVSGTSKLRIQGSYCSSCNGNGAVISADGCDFTNTYRGDVEDYTLNISALSVPDPVANDDNLTVLADSTAGTDNQVDVSTNDNIGTSHGTDGDDYAINTTPTNGTVSEITDGVFEYVPNPGYEGADSFTYNLCDSNNDCATATVNVTVQGITYCTPDSNSDTNNNNLYISNVFLDGNGAADINNTSGDDGGYADYRATPAAILSVDTAYPITITASSTDGWPTSQAQWSVYADLNGDGDFTDAGETLYRATGQGASPFSSNITIPNGSNVGNMVIRVAVYLQNDTYDSCGNTNTGYQPSSEYEDYLINVLGADTPFASDDELSVLVDSTSGTANQIDVSTNDNLGTDGGDGDNFALTSGGTTTNGGTVTEITDGVFEYIPAAGYLGADSFTYQICDAGTPEDCATATVNISVNRDYCAPTSTTNGTHYIDTFAITGENATNINNNSGDNGGYADFTATLPALEVYKNNTYTGSITVAGGNMGWAIFIDYNQDGDFEDTGELVADTGGEGTGNLNFTVLSSAITGNTVMRVGSRRYWYSNNPCGNTDGHYEEFEDYLVNIAIDPSSPAEMDISGNGAEVLDNATTTSATNLTNFGTHDIFEPIPLERTFTITNNGNTDLILDGTPVVVVTGSADFTISAQPAVATLASGQSTTFTVAFNPSVADPNTPVSATISIDNNDSDEDPYNFVVEGYGDQTFGDTDGDGIPDNVDIDDDNDGLTDEYEQNSCLLNASALTTRTTYLNEDFDAGTDRKTTDGVTYCYEDGFGSCNSSPNLNDGEYVVYYKAANGDGTNNTPNGEVASWADVYWYPGLDHTPGDTHGRMAMFNAEEDPGVFYQTTISGVSAGVDITYGFSAINLDRADAPGIGSRERPSVLIEILDPSGAVIASESSGDIQPTTDYVNGDWVEVSATFSTTYTSFTVRLSNEAPGGLGNDLAIDDIFVYQTLCDLDGDGVEDSIDLDNDDDGIPNVVELFLTDDDKDGTVNNDSGAYAWVDANNNGLIDIYDHQDINGLNPGDSGFSGSLGTPIDLSDPVYDTDGDGVVNYLDLDSDNDGIFDTVEYDNRGDVDVDGDGNGDGSDKQVLDVNGDPIDNDIYDGDGILNLADNNDDDADDSDHGTANAYPTPLDDDGDGLPNYLDVDSADSPNNFSNGSDIDTTEIYAHLDADNDGIIDGTTDTDGDGILDAFDTDNTVFGSPRDLNDSFTLFFDGRNDYVEDDNIINAWPSATLMAWIKIEPGSIGQRIIAGQDSFILRLENGNAFTAFVNGVTTTTTNLTEGVWVHVAASYDGVNGTLNQYVNGELINNPSVSGSLPADTSNFTIGRMPNTDSNYFQGEIDEVRVFNAALSTDEIQKMVYQELDDTNSFDSGLIIPYNIATTLNTWLIKYYKMDTFKADITDNKTTATIDVGTGARLYNIKNIYYQTAPLPYETVADGDWSSVATWLHGDVWDITDEANNMDWSIVHVKHNVTTSARHGTLGLIVDSGVTLEINNDVELQNTWYLNLEGTLDLQGESQLVQTQNSNLIGTGILERDQQGTVNLYTYNYWSSPVHTTNPNSDIDGDESYTISSVLLDGTDAANPQNFNFVAGYNGNEASSPKEISEYWMWKFANQTSNNYYAWKQIKSTGELKVGEGYSMKGYGTGAATAENNYVFKGTPNNGDITLSTDAGNDYLVGNPYPSAIDGYAFILDNTHTDGTLYFWEHFGGGTHVLREYQGGYGQLNLSGGVPAVSHTDVAQSGASTKTPEQYVPVGQGFFIKALSNGNTTFNNDQRVFVTESSLNSTFLKSNSNKNANTFIEDSRTKIRLNISSETGYTRQLLVTVDENATIQKDWGYDGALIENNNFDAYWMIEDEKHIIQGIDTINSNTTKLPLGVKSKTSTTFNVTIESLEFAPENMVVYIKDNTTNTYFNLIEANFSASIEQEELNNRFEIVFNNETVLSTEDAELTESNINLYFNSQNNILTINNFNNQEIKSLKLYNTLGQVVFNKSINSYDSSIEIPLKSATGLYIASVATTNSEITKKIIISN
ncbi:GEVED domain-containing protein [Tamlana sp. 62-3]|uniref:GEVED domain-containing protein n=1 Tax=Neotamlana sargassicola TaxID=2883125 RepID=A0A9X1I3D0_9FLAO|nr:GEVED domain-containing protein [Tamlana sargassicola]MCB4807161.1 GEVED domain-containing protein [Tamlana sargassicola]